MKNLYVLERNRDWTAEIIQKDKFEWEIYKIIINNCDWELTINDCINSTLTDSYEILIWEKMNIAFIFWKSLLKYWKLYNDSILELIKKQNTHAA